jgi:nicotinate-nucleotide adenylyltransferase
LEKNVVPAPALDISSTQLRDRIAKGLSIRYLTPDAVIDYIEQNKVYQSGVAGSAATIGR